MQQIISFDDYFSVEYLKTCFKEKLKGRKGGGRDRMDPDKYIEKYPNTYLLISEKCLNGNYKFSTYNEKLVSKGRNKIPRVISIPGVRDRLTLVALNKYLQAALLKNERPRTANELVRSVQNYHIKNSEKPIRYIKTDFSAFYDNIDRKVLLSILYKYSLDNRALDLISKAIEIPTKAGGKNDPEVINEYGIPQGLAISNILSDLYLRDFDKMAKSTADSYLRYVDDVLILNPYQEDPINTFDKFITDQHLHLSFHPDKTKEGILQEDSLDFLGYEFRHGKTYVRQANVTSFFNRIAKECVDFKKKFENPLLRPEYLKEDDEFINARIHRLNLSITGIKAKNKYYGWVHYYQQIDDVNLLSMIDRKIKNRFLRFIPKSKLSSLKSLTRTYYSILSGDVDKIIFNFDVNISISEKKAFLETYGYLDPNVNYDKNEIEFMYERRRDMTSKKMEAHIGIKS